MTRNTEEFPGLIALVEGMYMEMESDFAAELREKDYEYNDIIKRKTELANANGFIERVLEGEGAVTLSAEEHAVLVEYLRLKSEAEEYERKNLYYSGHRDCFSYLLKIKLF